MKIGVVGSMQYTERLIEARDALRGLGHDAFVTKLPKPLHSNTRKDMAVLKKLGIKI